MSLTSSVGRWSSFSQERAQASHPMGVLPGGVVAKFRHHAQPFDGVDLLSCPAQVRGVPRPRSTGILLQAPLEKAGVKKRVDVEEEVLHLHRFDQEVLGPSPYGPFPGRETVKRADGNHREKSVGRAFLGEDLKQAVAIQPGHADVEGDQIRVGSPRCEEASRGSPNLSRAGSRRTSALDQESEPRSVRRQQSGFRRRRGPDRS